MSRPGLTRAASPPAAAPHRRVAVCFTGELRTFGMPFVHNNLLAVVKEWQADTFFVYNPSPVGGKVVGSTGEEIERCEHNASALRLFEPKAVVEWQDLGNATSVAQAQLQQWRVCYEKVRAQPTKYGIFARLRPDLAVMAHPVPLPSDAELQDDSRPLNIYRTSPKADFAFLMAMRRAGSWLAQGERLLSDVADPEARECCIEYSALFHEEGAPCGQHGCECHGGCRLLNMSAGLMRNADLIDAWGAPVRARTAAELAQSTCPHVHLGAHALCRDAPAADPRAAAVAKGELRAAQRCERAVSTAKYNHVH